MMTTVETLALSGEQLSDAEVVRRVVAGDAALFEILMRRHNQRIYRGVRAVLRSDEDVEDVMQQAYINAYEHLGQFAGDAQFSTWRTRIAINEALRRRKRARVTGEGDDVTISLVEDERPDPEQQASTAELRELLEREVAALPESYRLVIMLRDVEGLSTAETARASLANFGAALVVADIADALDLAERIAPEHLQLVGSEAEGLAPLVRSAGAIFVGSATPEVFGDYIAGPSHVLPTCGSARFASSLGVEDFLRRSHSIRLSPTAAGIRAAAAATLAEAEGLPAHAAAARRRLA